MTAESTSGRNGPKYFVLTFVLCGCIAGIVLAVIALYVVRRHSRSKRKLQQLAATGDGTEASKDYQVGLCTKIDHALIRCFTMRLSGNLSGLLVVIAHL